MFNNFRDFNHWAASCQPGSWVMAKFPVVTLNEDIEEKKMNGDPVKTSLIECWDFIDPTVVYSYINRGVLQEVLSQKFSKTI